MSRNNKNRTGAAKTPDAPVAAVQQTGQANNSVGLTFVVPTEHVDLPSRGMFYPEDHPLAGEDTIEIRHMTAKDEEILTSKALLKKGVAIDRLLQSLIVDKRIKVGNLLIGDKNAILIMTRTLAYGAEYSTRVTCPHCTESSVFQFNLVGGNHTHPDDIETPEIEGYTKVDSSTFGFILPKTQVLAQVRLLTGDDETYLARVLENRKKQKLLGALGDSILTEQMKRTIVSLNGITDRSQIDQFIMNMPAADSRHFRNVYAKLTPNYDLTQEFSCVSCGESSDMEVPLTAEFFWPKS
jgi:hypothetical protein